MPARHEPSDGLLLGANITRMALVDERGCRRDIRSNGWIVVSREFALSKTGPAEETEFSSFGADLMIRNFTGGLKAPE